ncbi:MHCK/EF2 kinase domain protein [Ancylostoma duodenale]|uniref:Eukaryotic elongation factor 2 kinase n=1 Tax=Ancylostoma duodenale TaxID=51022 RepID=A0A0C2H8R2_9BILA|nr:MHCK/EF2 kinase domain protein [Ancylostoma duodenale]
MNRDNVISALQATTVGDNQKVESFLDERTSSQEVRAELASRRTTTSSSDGADWRRLCVLTNEDERSDAESSKTEATSSDHVITLMERWRSAARRARKITNDPWSHFFVYEVPITRAKRYRYSSIRKTWTEDIVEVRLHPEPFARGAMRECYRLKKLPSNSHSSDWKHAHNYVAKRYIQEVDRSVLFEDVKLQMDAKLWAEEYNRYDPPKKIDIVQMCVLEMIDMPSEPLFHLEHFIEGDYIKYNSNSGFVSDVARKTPQAFSHFTFERSGHQMIVVDIQGVGDLYTDPQIHTVVGTDYGDGNLGTRGMALFFHSHLCNDICHSLCLTEFDLSETERTELKHGTSAINVNQSTVFSRHVSACSAIVPELIQEDAMECLRQRTISMRSRTSSTGDYFRHESRDSSGAKVHDDDCICEMCLAEVTAEIASDTFSEATDDVEYESEEERPGPVRKVGFHRLTVERRERSDSFASSLGSSSLGSSSRITRDTEKEEYWSVVRRKSMPAGILSAMEMQQLAAESSRLTQHASILGQIHLDMARYHELGRFLPENDDKHALRLSSLDIDTCSIKYDEDSALFHLDIARRCGVLEAIITVAHMAFKMPHDLLKDIGDDHIWMKDGENGEVYDREEFAFELMETAAEMGDRSAMLFVAESFETGRRMGPNAQPSYPDAIKWYEKMVGFTDDDCGEGVALPRYEVLAKMAGLYQEGGCGLTQNFEIAYNLYTEAAEVAIEAMKGKLANKYYEQAEMCAR